jgi:hypothetical protein
VDPLLPKDSIVGDVIPSHLEVRGWQAPVPSLLPLWETLRGKQAFEISYFVSWCPYSVLNPDGRPAVNGDGLTNATAVDDDCGQPLDLGKNLTRG